MKNGKEKNAASEPENVVSNPEAAGTYAVKTNKKYYFIAKIACVIGAFLVWLYVANNDTATSQKTFNAVPVSVTYSDSSLLSVYSGYNSTVDITVSGKRSELNKLTENDIKVTVDVSSITEAGKYKLSAEVDLPNGVQLVSQNPDTISMYIDNRTSVTVPVALKMTNTAIVSGYELGTEELSADEVVVTGPDAVLSTIEKAQLTVSLGRVTATTTYTGSIVLIDKNGDEITNPYVKTNITDISVLFPVYVTKDVPITVGYRYGFWNDGNVDILISPSTIRLKGEVDVMNRITELQVAVIDEKKQGVENSTYISPNIELDDGIVNVDNVSSVLVRINQVGTKMKTIVLNNIAVNNPNDLKYTLVSDKVSVTIRAPETYIATLDSAVLSVSINLENVTNSSGIMSVPLDIAVNGVYSNEVYAVGDYSAMINIE